ncbi:hypothetical protein LWC34_09590 [Kibdelosporangium philippinense]|uniref:Uncharacterized protein n=1 Tax=Kibdelosporangium philippinense TaxID=211113 RepID=A0ABS8Z962_9PSEU|nr:hypothetical protein [Kibdelosporangium philippinense]MCE7003078.1 hypothetical protein [Kibdelosporangium philippinense]
MIIERLDAMLRCFHPHGYTTQCVIPPMLIVLMTDGLLRTYGQSKEDDIALLVFRAV